jgi:hypothetical protein
LNSSFWNNEGSSNSLKIWDFFPENDEILMISSNIKECLYSEGGVLNSDLKLYTELVQEGKFYEFMADEMYNHLGITFENRKDLKGMILMILYSDNWTFNQNKAAPKRVFAKLFPTVHKIFAAIKKGDRSRLPILLQGIESKMVLDVITRRIDIENPSIPIFTIHDSVVTTIGNEKYVKEILLEEMVNAIGFTPQLSTEEWLPENLKYNDGKYYDVGPL